MCKFLSKSGGVPFQISFFWGDLTRNDPIDKYEIIPDNLTGSITQAKKKVKSKIDIYDISTQ